MKKFTSLFVVVSIILLAGLGCKKPNSNYKVTLDMWGTFDNNNAYTDEIEAYLDIDKNVKSITYHKYTLESYKEDLLNALAAGNGPDIFMIQNSWMPDFMDKVVPAPDYMMTEQEFRNTFVDVAASDLVYDGKIYGVPLSVDSLALYYNKDIFNAAGVTRPPKTWSEFDGIVKRLTKIDEFGNFAQSGAAIGTAFNVNRSMDILTALMMQEGAEMSRRDGTVLFAEPVNKGIPGERALRYYTSFASASSPVYTWNKKQNYSIDAFFEEKAAMMINYSWHYDTIKAKNAKLNFAVAELPQKTLDTIGSQANIANYWVFVVAKNKQPTQINDPRAVIVTDEMRVHEAWQFLRAMAFPSASGVTLTNFMNGESLVYTLPFDLTEKYLEKTGKPAARRDLIDKQKTDLKLGAFVKGNLIARSWWRNDAEAVDAIFADMIDNVNTGTLSPRKSLELGAKRVQQLMKRSVQE